MLKFVFAAENLPFAVALGILIGLALLEVIGALVGFALSHFFDASVDIDVHDGDVSFLEWLGFGAAPAMVVLFILLGAFGLAGLGLQTAAKEIQGQLLNPWIASAIALVPAALVSHWTSKLAGRYLFKESTLAVSDSTFIGKPATLTAAHASKGRPAEAKLRDEHGQTHYVLVEPYREEDVFSGGSEVLIVDRVKSVYQVVENSADALSHFEFKPLLGEDLAK